MEYGILEGFLKKGLTISLSQRTEEGKNHDRTVDNQTRNLPIWDPTLNHALF